MSQEQATKSLRKKLNIETGQLEWSELQRHFARGVVIAVSSECDLIETAIKFTKDDRSTIENWMTGGHIKRADDDNARHWQQTNASFWAIVVAPWILVQEINDQTKSE